MDTSKLTIVPSDKQKRVADARTFLAQQAEMGFDHVIVIGYDNENGKVHITSSMTDDVFEDIKHLQIALLQKWDDTKRPGRRK